MELMTVLDFGVGSLERQRKEKEKESLVSGSHLESSLAAIRRYDGMT
jgi:hypothetical protein